MCEIKSNQLGYIKKLPKEYLDDTLVRLAHHSSALEGNTITLAETLFCTTKCQAIVVSIYVKYMKSKIMNKPFNT